MSPKQLVVPSWLRVEHNRVVSCRVSVAEGIHAHHVHLELAGRPSLRYERVDRLEPIVHVSRRDVISDTTGVRGAIFVQIEAVVLEVTVLPDY